MNAALAQTNRAPLPDEVIAGFVGNGAPMLVRRTLAAENGIPVDEVDEAELATTYAFFLDHYREHKLDFTRAYPGALESLEALRLMPDGTPRTLAVLTNKPGAPGAGRLRRPRHRLLLCRDLWRRQPAGQEAGPHGPSPVDGAGRRKARRDPSWWATARWTWPQPAMPASGAFGCMFGFGPQNLMENPPDVVVDSAADWAVALNPATMGVGRPS